MVQVHNSLASLYKPSHSGQRGDHTEALEDDQASKEVGGDMVKAQAQEYKQEKVFDLIEKEEEDLKKW